jgi:hypothetical protein
MLKDMVRARKADARTRELKAEVASKRRIRTDAPPNGNAPIEVSPASSGVTPARLRAAIGGQHDARAPAR